MDEDIKQLEVEAEERMKKMQRRLYLTIAAVVVLWVLIPAGMMCQLGKPTDAGGVGDIFGTVNALFSALAFAFLIYTANMQREELFLQRKELVATRIELKKSADSQSTLVELTREQLNSSTRARKKSIFPQLKYEGVRPLDPPHNNMNRCELRMQVWENNLKLKQVLFHGLYKIQVERTSLAMATSKIFEHANIVSLLLMSPDFTFSSFNEIAVEFRIEDVDGNIYKQILREDNEIGMHLSVPEEVK